ncbi:MAG: hypothetical protein ABR598_04555 [Candidatus Dormibacteria bacterium]
MKRFVQALLLLNITFVVINKIVEFRTVMPQAAPGSLLRTAVTDLFILSAVFVCLMVLVFTRFESDPTWLFVPVLFLVPLAIMSLYTAISAGGPLVPAVIRSVFAACFIVAYFRLRDSASRRLAAPTADLSPA